tara:strand:+ start:303 stop:773 length:471 start_codon:yes stop_codon:yes gene_type:complete
MNLFLSQYVNKIDKKGRVTLPSTFRSVLHNENKKELILFKSLKFPAVEGCSYARINKIAERIDKLDLFSEDQDDFTTSIFSEIVPTHMDKEGRFLIPDFLKEYSNINNEATFIGQGHYFQIWEPSAVLVHQRESRERLVSQKKTLGSIIINKSHEK